MPILLQVNFTPGEKQVRETQDELNAVARAISELPGFRWKIWIKDEASSTRGGIYLFEVNEEASAISRAPLQGGASPAPAAA